MTADARLVRADAGGPLYARRGGAAGVWLGGDGGFACAVPGPVPRYVMTLGDCYHGPAAGAPRRVGVVLANTVCVGVWRGSAGWVRSYYCGGTAAAVAPFFDDPDNARLGTRFAAQRPFTVGGQLFVLLTRIRNDGVHFEPVGCVLARVSDPSGPPPAWAVEYLPLSASGVPAFGNECFPTGPDLVVYGLSPGPRVTPWKLPAAALSAPAGTDLSGLMEYYAASGLWAAAASGAPAWDCAIPTTAGFGVRWTGRLWRVVYTDTRTGGGFPPGVLCAEGPGPFGPWSEPRLLGYFPEMAPDDPEYHPDNVAYAARETGLGLSVPGSVAVSYTVGSRKAQAAYGGDESRQLTDPAVYVVRSAAFADPFA